MPLRRGFRRLSMRKSTIIPAILFVAVAGMTFDGKVAKISGTLSIVKK
jgi:hypothetical protein